MSNNISFNNSFLNPTLHIKDPSSVIICSDLHLGTNNKFIKCSREKYAKNIIDFIGDIPWSNEIITLGDLFDGEYDKYFPINRVFSLKGNHYYQNKHSGSVTWIPEGTVLKIESGQKTEIVLSHRPYTDYFSRGVFNLCGHLHGQKGYNPVENSFDCGIENALKLFNGNRGYFYLNELQELLGI